MRILAITNMYPTRDHPASGTFVEQQVQGLRNLGQAVDVLLLDRQVEGPGVYRDMAGRISDRMAGSSYDLMHVMYGGVMAYRAAKRFRDVPLVVTFHGTDVLGESGTLVRRLAGFAGRTASKRAALLADGIVVVWKRLAEVLPTGIDRSKIRVIPNGIDLERFRPRDPAACRRELGWAGDAVHVLFATNGSAGKRPELARTAVARLRERGVPARLHELRGVDYRHVPVWINASDMLLMTSRSEASPTIVKECLACNVPVVSVDVGDVRERVEGIDGCLVLSADANELAAGMEAVHSAYPRVSGRPRIESLSFECTTSCLHDFYCETIHARSSLAGRAAARVRVGRAG